MVSEPNPSTTTTMSNGASYSSPPSGLGLQYGSVTEKLGRDNYPLWKAQVMPPLRTHQLVGFLDDTMEAPPKTITVEMENKQGRRFPRSSPTRPTLRGSPRINRFWGSSSPPSHGRCSRRSRHSPPPRTSGLRCRRCTRRSPGRRSCSCGCSSPPPPSVT
jgi:hypothetical protein